MSGKRLFDIVVAASVLVVVAPVMVLIAAIIKLESPGPCLFRQTRVGRYGRPFGILKFRTMQHMPEAASPGLATKDDPRVLRFGRLLREYKLNELPQLFNVLRGDMSIVGPRPELPAFVTLYKKRDREALLSVRPGITDPASLLYCNESDLLAAEPDPNRVYIEKIMPRKHAISRRYLHRQSLLGDAAIVLATAFIVVRPRSIPRTRRRVIAIEPSPR